MSYTDFTNNDSNNFEKDTTEEHKSTCQNKKNHEPHDHKVCGCKQRKLEEQARLAAEGKTEDQDQPKEDFRDMWLRALAETENLRRRLEKEKEEHVRYANYRFGKELLLVLDNLERALASVPEDIGEPTATFRHGVDLTCKEIFKAFNKFGITKIEALKNKFDPNYHQVISEKEDNTCEPHTIIEVLQDGYMFHDRLLRPSLVVVSKNS